MSESATTTASSMLIVDQAAVKHWWFLQGSQSIIFALGLIPIALWTYFQFYHRGLRNKKSTATSNLLLGGEPRQQAINSNSNGGMETRKPGKKRQNAKEEDIETGCSEVVETSSGNSNSPSDDEGEKKSVQGFEDSSASTSAEKKEAKKEKPAPSSVESVAAAIHVSTHRWCRNDACLEPVWFQPYLDNEDKLQFSFCSNETGEDDGNIISKQPDVYRCKDCRNFLYCSKACRDAARPEHIYACKSLPPSVSLTASLPSTIQTTEKGWEDDDPWLETHDKWADNTRHREVPNLAKTKREELARREKKKSSTLKMLTCVCCDKRGPVTTMKKCARCRSAAYCSIKCQTEDWRNHERTCTNISKAAASLRSEKSKDDVSIRTDAAVAPASLWSPAMELLPTTTSTDVAIRAKRIENERLSQQITAFKQTIDDTAQVLNDARASSSISSALDEDIARALSVIEQADIRTKSIENESLRRQIASFKEEMHEVVTEITECTTASSSMKSAVDGDTAFRAHIENMKMVGKHGMYSKWAPNLVTDNASGHGKAFKFGPSEPGSSDTNEFRMTMQRFEICDDKDRKPAPRPSRLPERHRQQESQAVDPYTVNRLNHDLIECQHDLIECQAAILRMKMQHFEICDDKDQKPAPRPSRLPEQHRQQEAQAVDPYTVKRLKHDLIECQAGILYGIAAAPLDDENILEWAGIILGPRDTPWEGGRFRVVMSFPHNYPFRPPRVQFTTPVVHPNICPETGEVYMDILDGGHKDNSSATNSTWSPAWCASAILISIQSLLDDPSTDIAINRKAARLYDQDRSSYTRKVLELVMETADAAIPEHLDRMLLR